MTPRSSRRRQGYFKDNHHLIHGARSRTFDRVQDTTLPHLGLNQQTLLSGTPTIARKMSFLRPLLQSSRHSFTRQTPRYLSTSTPSRATDFPFRTGPAPPRLPKEEQELYEKLQRESTGAFSTPLSERRSPPKVAQSPHSESENTVTSSSTSAMSAEQALEESVKRINAEGKGEELHPDVKRGVQPEFEGERNPKTGEVGGPKNEPLRWGHEGDWSYNGRVTDF